MNNMGIFDKIVKKLRGGAAAPNEHGPAVMLEKIRAQEAAATEALLKQVAAKPKTVKVEIAKATVSDKPGCPCGGQCNCGTKPVAKKTPRDGDGDGFINDGKKNEQKVADKAAYTADVKKTAVKKAATAPVAKKPVAKTTEKKQAIAKDLADTPAPTVKKPVAKKPAPKKAK